MVGKLDKEIKKVLYQKKKEEEDQLSKWYADEKIFADGLYDYVLNKVTKKKKYYQEEVLNLFRDGPQVILWSDIYLPFCKPKFMKKLFYDRMVYRGFLSDYPNNKYTTSKLNKLFDQICSILEIEEEKSSLQLSTSLYSYIYIQRK